MSVILDLLKSLLKKGLPLLAKVPARVWGIITLGTFIFCLGAAVGHGCGGKAVSILKTITVVKWDTIPGKPYPVYIPGPIRWYAKHDTTWRPDTSAGKIAQIGTVQNSYCESVDTTTPLGMRLQFSQCFTGPDSLLRKWALPPQFIITPAPTVEKTLTNTIPEIKIKREPTNYAWEAAKILGAGIVGAILESRAK